MCKTLHQSVVSHMPPTRDLSGNPDMGPDWESNQRSFSSQAGTQATESHQPGPMTDFKVNSSPNPHVTARRERKTRNYEDSGSSRESGRRKSHSVARSPACRRQLPQQSWQGSLCPLSSSPCLYPAPSSPTSLHTSAKKPKAIRQEHCPGPCPGPSQTHLPLPTSTTLFTASLSRVDAPFPIHAGHLKIHS